jgi:phosphinothricin acetyltransferase
LFVCEIEEQVVGWLSLSAFYGRPAYANTAEVSVYVDPRERRKGHGTGLLHEALRRAPALGIETLVAFIFGHNLPSVALFEKLGFQEWGRMPEVAKLDGVKRDLLIFGRRTT